MKTKLLISALALLPFSFSYAQISDLPVSATATLICSDQSTSITTTGSEIGVSYSLRNDSNIVIDGPKLGTGNDLTFNTGPISASKTFNVFAEQGTALTFDGVNDYINLSTFNRDMFNEGSVACWVNTTYSGGYQYLISNYAPPINGYFLGINASGKVEFAGRDGNIISPQYSSSGVSSTSVNDGEWHFVFGTMRYDSNSGQTIRKIYVDGVLENTGALTNNGLNLTNSTALIVGFSTGGPYFTGAIDDISIWKAAISDSSIASYYTTCLTGSELGLTGYFNLDEATGNVANDLSSSATDGTLFNFSPSAWLSQPTSICKSSLQMTQTVTINTLVIEDETVTGPSTVCNGTAAEIVAGSSVVGVNYSLLDATDNIVAGPIAGTGDSLVFITDTITSSATYSLLGEGPSSDVNNALNFDGTDDYLNLTTSNRGVTNQLTIACWIKTNVTGTAQYFFSKYNVSNGYLLYINSAGKVTFDGKGSGGAYTSSGPSTTSVNDGQWHYVVGTARIGGTWKIYVDGVWESGSTSANGSSFANASSLTIGTYNANYANIMIDEVAIWNVALDASSIQANYTNCLTGVEDNLTGYFNFNETSGTSTIDLSPSIANGTMANMDPESGRIANLVLNCNTTTINCELVMTQSVTIEPTIIDNSTDLSDNIITALQAGATYRWLDCDNGNAPISGEISASFSPTSNGNYAVEITMNGCVDTSDCVAVISIGISEINSLTMDISPNPATNFLNVNYSGKINIVSLYSISGNLLQTIRIANNKIDISHLSTGMYILELQSDTEICQKRFIKE